MWQLFSAMYLHPIVLQNMALPSEEQLVRCATRSESVSSLGRHRHKPRLPVSILFRLLLRGSWFVSIYTIIISLPTRSRRSRSAETESYILLIFAPDIRLCKLLYYSHFCLVFLCLKIQVFYHATLCTTQLSEKLEFYKTRNWCRTFRSKIPLEYLPIWAVFSSFFQC